MIYYLYPEELEEFVEEIKSLPQSGGTTFYPYGSFDDLRTLDLSEASHIITSGSIPQIKEIMILAHRSDLGLGIVPIESQQRLSKVLDLPSDRSKAYMLAMQRAERKVDMFFCNDILVLDDVRIGETTLLKEFEYDYLEHTFLQRIGRLWRGFRQKGALKHRMFSVRTGKGDTKSFSAIGIIALDYDNRSWIASALGSYIGSGDGKHVLAILSPRSLWQFFIKQPIEIILSARDRQRLPASLGFIKDSNTYIETNEPVEVLIDDSLSIQTPVKLETKEDALALNVGEGFWKRQNSIKSEKSNIKLDNMPKDTESIKYLSRGLPLFSHASQEQYSSLFTTLREEGRLSGTFVMLLILSTLIAAFGLFINSSSVIIGAMLLAPLMQPIVSLSMGVLRQDSSMQINAAKTIGVGIGVVLSMSAFVAFAIPLQRLTEEMAGRLSPTILDLFVAIVSGVAAAYVKNNEKILSSLAGVAIAVALVPPLSVAGIAIGWWDWHMFGAAFLLFATNLAGIVLSAALTFMLLGYSPVSIARRGLFTWLLIVALIAVPLYSTFGQMRENARIQKLLTHRYFDVGGKKIELNHIEVIPRKGSLEIRCEVISSGILQTQDKEYLKNVISKTIGKKVEVIATFRYRL